MSLVSYYQIKILEEGQDPETEGVRFGSKFSSLQKAKEFADSLPSDGILNNRECAICVFDISTRLADGFYTKVNGEWRLGLNQGPESALESLFEEAFDELDHDFDLEEEASKARRGKMDGSRIHGKLPKNAMHGFSSADILKMRKKFLK